MERSVSVRSILHDFEKVLTAHRGENTLYANILDMSDNLEILKEKLESWARILNWLVCRLDPLKPYQAECQKVTTLVNEVVSNDRRVKLLMAASLAKIPNEVDDEIRYLHAHLHYWIQSHYASETSPSPLIKCSMLSQRVPMCVVDGEFGTCSRSILCRAVSEVTKLFEVDIESSVLCSLENDQIRVVDLISLRRQN